MLKVVVFCKRKAGMSIEEFQRHWRTTHAELVARQAGLRRYVQNHVFTRGDPAGESDYDGVAEAWFDDDQAMRDLATSAEYAAVRADEAEFVDPASMGVVSTDEAVIVDGPAPTQGPKRIAFLRKRPGVPVDQFQKHWREVHGPIAAAIPGVRRYVQCHARRGIYAAGRTPTYDGIATSWFDDLESLRAGSQTQEYARARADEPNFLISGRVAYVIASEVEIELAERALPQRLAERRSQ